MSLSLRAARDPGEDQITFPKEAWKGPERLTTLASCSDAPHPAVPSCRRLSQCLKRSSGVRPPAFCITFPLSPFQSLKKCPPSQRGPILFCSKHSQPWRKHVFCWKVHVLQNGIVSIKIQGLIKSANRMYDLYVPFHLRNNDIKKQV